LFSLSRAQVRRLQETSAAGREISHLLERPRRLLVSILIGNLVVNIFMTSFATALFLSVFGERGLGYAFLLLSVLIIAFGEIIPKAVAMHWPQRFAALVIFPMKGFHLLVWPLRAPLARLSDVIIRLLRGRLGQAKRSFTHEELATAMRISRGEGELSEFEFEILTNVLAFRGKKTKEIATPNVRVVSAPITASRLMLLEIFQRSGLSRILIYEGSTDNIVGVLHIKDLLATGAGPAGDNWTTRLREPLIVQESLDVNELYNELQHRGMHLAVVHDEYSSFAGLVTIEDILEELVGEIRDARDPRAPAYMRIDDNRIVVPGTMEIDELNDVFDVRIEDEEHDTVAGLVMGAIGRIPRAGETVEVEGLRFHIISAQPNRIRKMRVEKT